MKRDIRDVARRAALTFDVCVVGSGPAGLTVAQSLAERGWAVGLLESGGDGIDARARGLADGEVAGLPYYPLRKVRARALGGSTRLWLSRKGPGNPGDQMRSRPLDPIDFERRPYVPEGAWPFGFETLLPWYDRASSLCGLSREPWRTVPDPALPGIQRSEARFASPALFRRLATAQSESDRVMVITGGTVTAMEEESAGAVSALYVANERGSSFRVQARAYVLAGGGIENARMLLLSRFGRPGGLANPHDQVGRYFMEHLHIDSGVMNDGPVAEHWRFGLGRFTEGGQRMATSLRVSDSVQRSEGLVNALVEFRDLAPGSSTPAGRSRGDLSWAVKNRTRVPELGGHLRNLLRSPGYVARVLVEKAPPSATVLGLVFTSEQTPWARSRVILGNRTDPFGLPVAKLEWHVAPRDLESLRRTQDILDNEMRTSGLGSISQKWGETSPLPRIDGCSHAIGTTRMSDDARTGVVDADCRVHNMRNLWVAGSSVMPTGGATTVTLTLVALALRLGDHLDGVLRA